ncbi:3-oxoacyl-ACP synthase [Sneathiella chungangensis]|uniref:3-oxoacyl-ACP synthase n=1 Tax=Sneathiella chungangensis TaxID=1418234 RepID=A0A845MD46_9PROT|nr:iron-containing redox enzyme family protein [Sneathiella chungangensis]MZR21799.1 3-oxoacyl-ACP synthase [Sneathiella chungangensis]
MTSKVQVQSVLRRLVTVWADFEGKLNKVDIIDRINRGKISIGEYRDILLNHRQQVVEGSRWIARAASSIEQPYLEQRATFLRHAATEQLDYKMLDEDFVNCGGDIGHISNGQKNIGSEALHAWMFHKASQKNPFDLLGAMFIIEGLGKNFAGNWVKKLEQNLNLKPNQTQFYRYHAEHDDDHIEKLENIMASGILNIAGLADQIVKTAKVTGRLYLLQLEEIGNV